MVSFGVSFRPSEHRWSRSQSESGTSVEEICRKMGVLEPTFYLYGRLSRCKSILI